RRAVTRVVTPGTILEERILPGPEHNFLACLATAEAERVGVAAVDVSTGEMFGWLVPSRRPEEVSTGLAPFDPSEILLSSRLRGDEHADLGAVLRHEFPRARTEDAPEPFRGTLPPSLVGLAEAAEEVRDAGYRLVGYLQATQPRLVPFVEFLPEAPGGRRLRLDTKTLRHLEISRPMNPDAPEGPTLLSTLDQTTTAIGRRTLSFWLRNPLAEREAIVARHDSVEALAGQGSNLLALRACLQRVPDLSRIAARIAGRRVRPPELFSLATGLEAVQGVRRWLESAAIPGRADAVLETLGTFERLVERIRGALVDPAPPTVDGGRLFRPGVDVELDRLRSEEAEALGGIERLERTEAEASGIRTLRVGYNQVFGYYFEVTRANLPRVPAHLRRKQTLSGSERFTSDALDTLAGRLLGAREKLADLEGAQWERFLAEFDPWIPAIHRAARSVGEVDALACFAHLAQTRRFIRPEMVDSPTLVIREGRHPILEPVLGAGFVPNDTELDSGHRLLLLTGPNMSGKSTYMRQVGLLIILAQAGAFVPARFARIGLVSSLHTRMGFTDEIGRGKSSFMAEMTEVAEILRSADERSVVLLDEVGRGTSTFDGLALAWGTLQHLHDTNRCRTIVATHYHQLTDLVDALPCAIKAHLAVKEGPDGIVFLRTLVPGSTDRSYGVHVARLAGIPPDVLAEAEKLLRRLEREMPPAGGRGRSAV
ncbi:MAG TPA: DNA mismatch repair protein MutS, partial [Thermoplasmata archaeon]|nr:DNA mismatch repair protein MutS [Thermoplasmata archaeon]